MLRNKKYYILALAAVLALIAMVIFSYAKWSQKTSIQNNSVSENQNGISGRISFTNGNARTNFEYEVKNQSTVFELMKTMIAEKKITMKYQESNAGVFVNSINNVKNDSLANMFWMLYVNDKLAPVGAGEYTLSAGDSVEWRYADTSKIDFTK